MNGLPHLFARAFNTPLMIHEDKAYAILTGLGIRLAGDTIELPPSAALWDHAATPGTIVAGTLDDGLGQRVAARGGQFFSRVGSVALIGIEGTLVHKGAWLGQSSGSTSYQGLQTQIMRAMNDPTITGVAFEVDSGGGEVPGVFQTADMIAALSQVKPTMAILTDHALSAAYLLASQTRQIAVPPTGLVGSIGAMRIHVDMTGVAEKQGAKVTVVRSGARKAEGHPMMPLGEESLAAMQASVDSARRAFADTVGRGRGQRLTAGKAMATEAAIYEGPKAVEAGLADVVAHPIPAFRAFVAAVGR